MAVNGKNDAGRKKALPAGIASNDAVGVDGWRRPLGGSTQDKDQQQAAVFLHQKDGRRQDAECSGNRRVSTFHLSVPISSRLWLGHLPINLQELSTKLPGPSLASLGGETDAWL